MKKLNEISYRTRSILLIALMAIVMFVIIFNSYRIFSVSSSNSKKVSGHLQNINRMQQFINLLIDAETGERGYVITQKEEFLQPYLNATQQLQKRFPPDSLLRTMPEYTNEVGVINKLAADELAYLNYVITHTKQGDVNVSTSGATEGKNTMDAIRAAVRDISDKESAKITEAHAENDSQKQNIVIILVAGTVLSVLLLLGYLILLTNNTSLQSQLSEELSVAKIRVNEASKVKSRFLSTMSHELRTPMNGVLGMSSLLLQTQLDEEQKKYATTIHRSGVELLAVINDVIDFSKIESGTVSIENSVCVTTELLEEVSSLLAPDRKNISIRFTIGEGVPEVIETDHARLRQILINVIANVLKISGQSGAHVKLTCKHCEENLADLNFEVLSEGGKQPLQHAVSENGFSRLDVSAGLGLSISTRLISLLGGSIKLDANATEASKIRFSIKVKPITTAEKAQKTVLTTALDNTLSQKFPLKILAVDDNDMNQTVMTSILSKLGYRVHTAPNGQEAYDKSIEEKFDLIFMDMRMPIMNGLESTKRIRQYHINTSLPVIIGVTADSLMHETPRWKETGMNDLIAKPYKASEIQALIQKWGPQIVTEKNPA